MNNFELKNTEPQSGNDNPRDVAFDKNPTPPKADLQESSQDKITPDNNHKITPLSTSINNPIWLSVSEAAKLGGIQTKTIRRAIQSKSLKYKVTSNRYAIELSSLITFLNTKTKLKNKFNQFGLGQYFN